MKEISSHNFTIQKVQELLKEKNLTSTDLGRVLGKSKKIKNDSQDAYQRGKRFLNSEANISMEKLVILAHFFKVSISEFFQDDLKFPHSLESGKNEKNSKTENLSEIEKNLREMGFDEDFIKVQIQQIKAYSEYNLKNDTKNK